MGDVVLSDGHWHTLQMVKNGSATVIQVDSGHPRVIQHMTQDFGGLDVLTFSLGGIPPGPAQQKTAAGEAEELFFLTSDYTIRAIFQTLTVNKRDFRSPNTFQVILSVIFNTKNVTYIVGLGGAPFKELSTVMQPLVNSLTRP